MIAVAIYALSGNVVAGRFATCVKRKVRRAGKQNGARSISALRLAGAPHHDNCSRLTV